MQFLYLLGLYSTLASAFDCSAKELEQYDFASIKGIYSAESTKSTPPSKTTFTWSVGICENLDTQKDCPKNSELCGLTRVSVDGKTFLSEVIDFNVNSQKTYTPFSTDGGNSEAGITITYKDVHWGDSSVDGSIKFICVDSGAEGENKLKLLKWDGVTFESEMRTPAACITSGDKKKAPGKTPKKDNSESWGWFTWIFIFMVLFLSIYIIGGAWFQYSKGNSIDFSSALKEVLENFVDLLKGLPSFIKEIIEKVSGNSNRGEYSAV